MEQEPFAITIVVSVYNVAAYVEKCLKSILTQTVPAFELLVVDDGSSDGSGALCRRLLANAAHARLYSIPHSGIGAVRNFGLAQARTAYIMFVDGDDYLAPDTVERLVTAIEGDQPDLAVFGFWYETEGRSGGADRRYEVSAPDARYRTRKDLTDHFIMLWDSGLMYSTCNKLFRTELIRSSDLHFEDRTFGEDFKFCREYLKACRSCTVIGACCYHYISDRSGSLSSDYRPDLFSIRREEHIQLSDYFAENGCTGKQAREFLARRHIERVVGCIENEYSRDNPKSRAEKQAAVRAMVTDPYTRSCARTAELRSVKMKFLVTPVKLRWVGCCCCAGRIMALCKRALPGLFTRLKMHR